MPTTIEKTSQVSPRTAQLLAAPPAAPIKLRVENLSVYYGNQGALEGVGIDLISRNITAVIGPSGCGKSTFLRALNRMVELNPDAKVSGQVILDGQPLYGCDLDLATLRMMIGYIWQKPNPFPSSIYDNVTYGPRLKRRHSRSELDNIVESKLRQAALWDEVKDKLKQSAFNLSGGQQQRLCIARTLAVGPDVLLMDEPCSALDPISTQKIEDLIMQLKEELTVVIVTHNMQQASRISDHTAFFLSEGGVEPGRLIEIGPTADIFTTPTDKRTENFITGRFG